MDELSGRGLGSGLGLGRVDQGSSFTTCSGLESVCARAGQQNGARGRGLVVVAAAAADDDDDEEEEDN
jgi:hypothetical protein